MKKLFAATALAASLLAAGGAQAASTILFDPDGLGGTYGSYAVDLFDWLPGNALAVDAIGSNGILLSDPANGIFNPFQVVAQSSLSVLRLAGGGTLDPTGDITFQLSMSEIATGTSTGAFLSLNPFGVSSFTVWYGGTVSSDKTGVGYGSEGGAIKLLEGTIVTSKGNYTDTTRGADDPIIALDGFLGDGDDDGGVTTHQGTGSSKVQIDITYQNSDFFKSLITSLLVDAQDAANLANPFEQANPSDQVVGLLPVYGANGTINGADCGTANRTCDFQFQMDASTSFNPVPEPASLALLGIGLAAAGVTRRRKLGA